MQEFNAGHSPAAASVTGIQANSVLMPYMMSADGSSAADSNRRLVGGGMMSSMNGESQSTYATRRGMDPQRSAV
jgi:hypothetical protein